jgi:hypothetical protein
LGPRQSGRARTSAAAIFQPRRRERSAVSELDLRIQRTGGAGQEGRNATVEKIPADSSKDVTLGLVAPHLRKKTFREEKVPYNVLSRKGDRPRTAYCMSAAEAADMVRKLTADGAGAIRVVSTEGIVVPTERLELMERAERQAGFGQRSRATP